MKRTAALLLLILTTVAQAAPVEIKGLRMWPAPDNTRLVFDLSAPVEHNLFTLKNPDRIVIDIKDTDLQGGLPKLDFSDSFIKRIRYGRRSDGDLRVVLDLKSSVRPKSFVLKPNSEYGNRLVIDLYDASVKTPPKTEQNIAGLPKRPRNVVVAIDAGHGGEDPGATGPNGTHEKDVVLAIAKRLSALVQKEPGMQPLMIRTGDYYIGLRERVQKAREHRADLFVSIHADSFRNNRASGSSVYTLSTGGASSEAARWLADKENASDLIGGVSLDDKDDLLAAVLLDLSQNATIEASHEVARDVLSDLGNVGPLHRQHVEQAGFVVLKSPDVPSILVETAFISNPKEERKLRNPRHQEDLAEAIMRGIRDYFHKNPPPGTLLALRERKHVITAGETLSAIAHQYQVSLDVLRSTNDLHSDVLQVGDVLRIPPHNSDS